MYGTFDHKGTSKSFTIDIESQYSNNQDYCCRICFGEIGNTEKYVKPCLCKGSLNFVHEECLLVWIKTSNSKVCNICGYPFNIKYRLKRFKEWKFEREDLTMTIISIAYK